MGILNTMLMSVLERTQQFGVMLAIGMKANDIIKMILAEAFVLGLWRDFGIFLGLSLFILWSSKEFDMSGAMGDNYSISGAVASSMMYGKYNWGLYSMYIVIALTFTVVSAIYPAWKIKNLKAIDALRHR